MALKLKPPGTNILGAFSSGLKDGPDLGEEFAASSSYYHLPAYAVTLKDLANLPTGQNIDSVANEVAWQCVAVSTSGSVVVCEVTPRSQGPRPAGHVFDGPVRMTSLSHGPIIDGVYKTAVGLAKIEADLIQKFGLSDDYEPRMLRIPGLLVSTIWLKSQTAGGTDWVVPLHTKISDLQKEMLFTMENFLEITRPLAKDRLASPIFD
jgi:hypothetical protein